MISLDTRLFFFLSGFSFTDTNNFSFTDDSEDSRGKGRGHLLFLSTTPSAHEHSDIYLQLCMFACNFACPYSELFWSVFSRIWIEYGEMLHISPYSVQIRENVDQNNSEYGHFSRSVPDCYSMRFTTLLTNYLID